MTTTEQENFDAFISYRRSDGAASARALRGWLLRYRLPLALRRSRPNRRLSIYLDRIYELAGEDFFQHTIKPALDRSQHLIVVATPDASKPREDGLPNWVEREIEEFLRGDSRRPFSVALAKGDYSDSLPASIEKKYPHVHRVDIRELRWWKRCWPPARWRAEDNLLAFVAALHRVPAPEMPLLHREEQRRRAAVGWATSAVTGVLVLVLSALLFWAITSERAQRSQAMALKAERLLMTAPDRGFLLAAQAFQRANTPEAERVLRTFLDSAVLQRVLPSEGNVARVVVSANGGQAVASDRSGKSTVWDLSQGSRLVVLDGVTATYSSDGGLILTNQSPDILVFDAKTGKLAGSLKNAGSMVEADAVSRQGHRLLTIGRSSRLEVWDILNGTRISTVDDRVGLDMSVAALSPDGSRGAVGLYDGNLAIWDASNGLLLHRVGRERSAIYALRWTAKGDELLVGDEQGWLEKYDVRSGQQTWRRQVHTAAVRGVLVTSDGLRVVSFGRDGTVRISTADDGNGLFGWQASSKTVEVARLSPREDMLLTVGDSGPKLWSTAEGALLANLFGHNESVNDARFLPDGRVVTASDDLTTRLWLPVQELTAAAFPNGGGPVLSAALSKSGAIITGSKDGVVRVWSPEHGVQPQAGEHHKEAVLSLALSPDEKLIASASHDGSCMFWDGISGKPLFKFQCHGRPIDRVSFSKRGEYVAFASRDGTVSVWDIGLLASRRGTASAQDVEQQARLADLPAHHGGATAAVFLSSNALLTSGIDGTLKLWQKSNTDWSREFRVVAQGKCAAQHLSLSPDLSRIAWSNCGTVHVASTRGWQAIGPPLEGLRDGIHDLKFDPQGQRLAVVGASNTRVWNVESGKVLYSVSSGLGTQSVAAFSPDGARLATGESDHSVRLWNADTGEPLGTFHGCSRNISYLAFSHSGEELLCAGRAGATRLLRVGQDHLAAAAERRAELLARAVELPRWDDTWRFGPRVREAIDGKNAPPASDENPRTLGR